MSVSNETVVRCDDCGHAETTALTDPSKFAEAVDYVCRMHGMYLNEETGEILCPNCEDKRNGSPKMRAAMARLMSRR